MLSTILSNVHRALPRLLSLGQTYSSTIGSSAATNQWSLVLNRSIVRYHFPKPNERRRIKRHGWFTRMATLGGRKVLMRRFIKGKYVLSH